MPIGWGQFVQNFLAHECSTQANTTINTNWCKKLSIFFVKTVTNYGVRIELITNLLFQVEEPIIRCSFYRFIKTFKLLMSINNVHKNWDKQFYPILHPDGERKIVFLREETNNSIIAFLSMVVGLIPVSF